MSERELGDGGGDEEDFGELRGDLDLGELMSECLDAVATPLATLAVALFLYLVL
jgi:hypothetical protein